MGRIIRVPVHPRCPSHLQGRYFHRLFALQKWANGIRGLYGVPVWLVGSALREGNHDPRDWDVRLLLGRAQFESRYGSVQEWIDQGSAGDWGRTRWRWSDDCVKISKIASSPIEKGGVNLPIDFQTMPIAYWHRFRKLPRMPLDTHWAGLP